MTIGFFRKNWDLVGSDVMSAVLDVFNNGDSLEVINKRSIVLIPKNKDATRAIDYRPISLLQCLI